MVIMIISIIFRPCWVRPIGRSSLRIEDYPVADGDLGWAEELFGYPKDRRFAGLTSSLPDRRIRSFFFSLPSSGAHNRLQV